MCLKKPRSLISAVGTCYLFAIASTKSTECSFFPTQIRWYFNFHGPMTKTGFKFRLKFKNQRRNTELTQISDDRFIAKKRYLPESEIGISFISFSKDVRRNVVNYVYATFN